MKNVALYCLLALIGGVVGGFLSNLTFSHNLAFANIKSPPKIIVANEFRVIDDEGNIQARFYGGSEGKGGSLVFEKIDAEAFAKHGFTVEAPLELPVIREINQRKNDKKGEIIQSLNLSSSGVLASQKFSFITNGVAAKESYSRKTQLSGEGLEVWEDSSTSLSNMVGPQMLSIGYRYDNMLCLDCVDTKYPRIQFTRHAGGNSPAEKQIMIGLYDSGSPYFAMGDNQFFLSEAIIKNTNIYLDKSGLEISDNNFKTRAKVGEIDLNIMRTGSIEKRPFSSIILLNDEGKVAWSAP